MKWNCSQKKKLVKNSCHEFPQTRNDGTSQQMVSGGFGVDPFSGEPTGPEPFLLSKRHKILSKWLPWPLDPDWKSHSLH